MTTAATMETAVTELPPTLCFEDVAVGDELPGRTIELSPTFVISTALASRDFEEVHHDAEVARAKGLDHIFLNILTTNGLCQQLVVEWAGPNALVKRSGVRLGVPAHANDSLAMSAKVTRVEEVDGDGEVDVEVLAMVEGGMHGKATVTVSLPRRADDAASSASSSPTNTNAAEDA